MANDDDDEYDELFQFVETMPKVELHAHLNGCIREKTLFELAKQRGVELCSHLFSETPISAQDHSMYNDRPRSLLDCFDIFSQIPKCVNDLNSLERITTEALEDFALHHVVYLELRSTPKVLLVNSTSSESATADKIQYCETILRCMDEFERLEKERYNNEIASDNKNPTRLPMVCRFIVAVDRSGSKEDALEHVELAIALKQKHQERLVGVDLGGNPTKNHFDDFRFPFEKARNAGIKITLHCAEITCDGDNKVSKVAFEEAQSILNFRPDRLGHALLLPPPLQKLLSELKIPIESCPTSNVMTLDLAKHNSGSLLEGLKKHPQLENWLQTKHPISIGTDDPGLFHTTATKELLLLQKAFYLNKTDLQRISLDSIDQAFCCDTTKLDLLNRMKTLMAGNAQQIKI